MNNSLDYAIGLEISKHGVVGTIDNVSATFLIKKCNDNVENSYNLNTLIAKTPFKQGSIVVINNDSYLVLDIEEQFSQNVYYRGIIRKCESFKTALDNTYIERHNVIGFIDRDKSTIVTTGWLLEENTYINATMPLSQYKYTDTYILYKNFAYMITDIDNTKEGLRIITAKKTDYPYSSVNSITLPSTSGNGYIDNTIQLSPICKENNVVTTNPIITYVSSDKDIATVDVNGLITCIAKGSVAITCKYGDASTIYSLNVVQEDVYSIECDTNSIVLNKDETIQLSPVVKLNGIEVGNPTLTYIVGNTSIATCNDGLVMGVGVGSTIITINYEDKAQFIVNVTIEEVQVTYTINGVDSFNQESSSTFTINPLRSCVFYIEDFDRENVAYITSDNGNGTCVVYGINNISDNSFILYVKDSSGNVLASKEINVLAW